MAISVLLLTGISWAAPQDGRGDRIAGRAFASRSPVLARNGIAATSHPLASQIAIDILKAGGSAVDAAIAANAAVGLMEPTGNGIGGDLFAIVWDPKAKKPFGLNASGRSPKGLTLEGLKEALGDETQIPLLGPLPISVPGTVDGWFELHDRFGKLPMKDVLAPAIRYALEGFPVTQTIAYYWRSNTRAFERNRDLIPELENFEKTYLINGEPPREGQVFQNPDLARTLETIAKGGRDAFYRGELAEVIDRYMKRIGGHLRKADFEAHRSEWVEPVSTTYRGYRVWELPPNGQGIAALQMLNLLESYDLAALGHNSAEYLHLQAEAKKLAFSDRARYYADPAFSDIPVETLISKEYATQRRERIDLERAAQSVPPGDIRLESGDTIYLTVADGDGMMVSLIQSNYSGMGSGLVPDGLGFMLQDRGALFSLEADHPNVYAPGKRPFHTIIPAFASKDGEPWLSFGVMGGAMQPQGHVQILCNLIDFGMNVQEAGDAARYRHTGSSQPTGTVMMDGGDLALESGIPEEVARALAELGHRIQRRGSFGGYQAILWDAENRVYQGATEMRKDGTVCGY
ncbi:MAG: gamma-glutamyltransferase [Planctomycetota bacterium]